MKRIILLLFLILPCFAFSQNLYSSCHCPLSKFTSTKADTIFRLSKNKRIVLCGYTDTTFIKGKKLYSEFVLSVCGSNKIIKFWDAMQICNVKALGDTLFVETIIDLPVGKAMSYKKTVWTTERIYFDKGTLKSHCSINSKLPKYNKQQIEDVLKLYKILPNDNSEKIDELADKLLISALSKSKEAAVYLINLQTKFTRLDGATQEYYDITMGMFEQWQKSIDTLKRTR